MRNITATPETSLAAYHSLSPELLEKHYGLIFRGLQKIKAGTYEEIAAAMKMEKNQVSRRLKEMVLHELVIKTEEKKPTRAGRSAFVYRPSDTASLPLTPETGIIPQLEITAAKNSLKMRQGGLF